MAASELARRRYTTPNCVSRVVIKENLLVKLEVTESWLWDLIAYAQS
jgi:hypothetical protein